MPLHLKIENETALPDGGPIAISVTNSRGIDIGRDAYLDWVLPDPTRTISGKHCEIRYRNGAYWLADTSTNGTFVNRSEFAIEAPHRLSSGDRIEIGKYIIAVIVEPEPVEDAPAESAAAPGGAGGGLWDIGEPAAPPSDPRELRVSRSGAAQHNDPLDWISDLPSSGAAFDPMPDPFAYPAPAAPAYSPPAPAFEPPAPAYSPPPPAAPVPPVAAEAFQTPAFDPVPPDFDAQVPEVQVPEVQVPQVQVPEVQVPEAPSPEPVAAFPAAPDGFGLPDGFALPEGSALPAEAPAASPQDLPPRAARARRPAARETQALDVPAPGNFAANPGPADAAAPPSAQQTPVSSAPGGSFKAAFARGAGLPPEMIALQNEEALAELAGKLVAMMTENLMQLHQARAKSKGVMRSANMTLIQARENNPLRFSPTAQDALRILLGPPTASYLNAERAVSASFEDQKKHQVIVFSAMQQALIELLAKFDPKKIEQDLPQEGGVAKMIRSKPARLWERYVTLWEAKAGKGEHGMVDAFMRLFAQSYDKSS